MDRRLIYTVPESDSGIKIEDFLKRLGCSHHVLTHLKRTENGITVNGAWAYASTRLSAGDRLELLVTEEGTSEQILPKKLPLSIVYEDEDLMIIDKAPDMPIHPSINNHENTLANAVMYYFSAKGQPFVYRCVNRLDRDTSGLLILAKNMLSAAILYRMSAQRQIRRLYLAAAEGLTPECGTIDAPIARAKSSAIMRCIDYDCGERAVTHYRRIGYYAGAGCSLLQIRLETGRTHQIRVHMTSIGHPLAGDFLYNPGSAAPISRQALHSCLLEFSHPITGARMSFTSDMPGDMQALLMCGPQ